MKDSGEKKLATIGLKGKKTAGEKSITTIYALRATSQCDD